MNIDAHTTRNPRYDKFSSRLAKVAQTVQKTRNRQRYADIFFREITVTFLQISRKPHFDLQNGYVFRKLMNRRFQQYTVLIVLSTFHS